MPDSRSATAIVTGAASGIGLAICERLATLGYRLVLIDREIDLLNQRSDTLATTAPHCEPLGFDVADAVAWRSLGEDLLREGADVALLVNAAGALLTGKLEDCQPNDIDRLVRTNLTGVMLGCSVVAPLLRRHAGELAPLPRGVLNVASIFAAICPPGFSVYNATKAGVIALSESLKGELAPAGLTVSVVLPGITRTGLFDRGIYASNGLSKIVQDRVTEANLSAESVAEQALCSYARGRLKVAIGRRARRYAWAKWLAPHIVLRRSATEANRDLLRRTE